MFNEKDFHKLIEKQNPEQKEAVWKELNLRIAESGQDGAEQLNNGNTVKIAKSKTVVISVVATFLALIAALAIILGLTFGKKNGISIRFCEAEDYTMHTSEQSLKEYSEEYNKNWLYFDWYADTEYFSDKLFRLNTTDEVICYLEEIIDNEMGYLVQISVTDNRTELAELVSFKNCDEKYSFNGQDIQWCGSNLFSMAKFEYKGYRYYLRVDTPSENSVALEYAKLLLS